MKKKTAIVMIGFAGSLIGSSCSQGNHGSPITGAGRVVDIDSANDRVIVDTSSVAVTRNVKTAPDLVVNGLFSRNIRPHKDDILFFTLDSATIGTDSPRVESCALFPYSLQ